MYDCDWLEFCRKSYFFFFFFKGIIDIVIDLFCKSRVGFEVDDELCYDDEFDDDDDILSDSEDCLDKKCKNLDFLKVGKFC